VEIPAPFCFNATIEPGGNNRRTKMGAGPANLAPTLMLRPISSGQPLQTACLYRRLREELPALCDTVLQSALASIPQPLRKFESCQRILALLLP
jgi:hypothetical protein